MKKRNLKKVLTAILSLTLVLGLVTGCTGNSSTNNTPAAATGGESAMLKKIKEKGHILIGSSNDAPFYGRGLAALAPHVYRASVKSAPRKFSVLSALMGGKDENDFVPLLEGLIDDLHLTATLGEQGLGREDADWMTENCLKVSAAGLANHPLVFTPEKIKEIYLQAM